MIVLIFCTDQFSTSFSGLWVCSNERAPTTPLQQSIRGIIESLPHHILACMRACTRRSPGFIYICRLFALFVVTCSVVSFCCSFLLGLSNILTFNTPCARCYYFFSHKRNTLPLGNRLLHTHSHTPKIRLRITILEFLLHTTYPPHRCRHLLDYSFNLFLLFLALFLSLFFPFTIF